MAYNRWQMVRSTDCCSLSAIRYQLSAISHQLSANQEVIPMLNPHICNHCANAYKDPCLTRCAPTGNYCAFRPRPLREWEQQPAFPVADFPSTSPLRQAQDGASTGPSTGSGGASGRRSGRRLEMTAREARVLLGLYLFWQSQQPCTERSEREAGVRTLSHNGHHGLPIYLRERRPS